jgi:outer membrane protein assembly factor BamA
MPHKLSWLPLVLAAGCAAEKANGRPWIHGVTIDGVKQVSKKDLKSKLAVEATSWVPFSPKRYLDPFTIDMDRQRVEAYYHAHGYFAAKVTQATVEPRDPHGKSVDVKLVVDEGPPTKIVKLDASGLDAAGAPAQKIAHQLDKSLALGTVFDHAKYLDEKARITTRLKRLGFAWANVDGEVDVNRDELTADVRLKIDPGLRARFGKVIVRGDTGTVAPRLIATRALIPTGRRFDPDELEAARGRLYNSGAFASVKIDYERDAAHPDVADVIVTVHPSKLHELRLGVGVGFESTRYDVHLAGNYVKSSFFGGLRSLKLRLEPGWVFLVSQQGGPTGPTGGPSNGPSLRTDATFTQPDLFAPALDLKWLVGYDVGIDYAYQYHGPRTTIGLTRPFWRNRVNLGFSYNFNFLLFFNTVPEFQNNPALATRLFGYTNPYRVGWLQQDVNLDLRDRPLDPHKGVYVGTTFEEGGVYAAGSFTYEKVQPELRLYAPLFTRRMTLAARGMFGQIFTVGGTGSPITRRFFMGGPNSHRGFNYDRLSLQVPSGIAGAPNLPIGGDQLVLLQAELRVDIIKLWGNWFGFTAFLDAGDVAAPSLDPASRANLAALLQPQCAPVPVYLPSTVQWNQLHYAVGGGLRYHTPIGTITADIGVRLNRLAPCQPDGVPNPDPGQRIAFHISIGEAF